ncbi:MAG: SagB/ThcOx family dehydrogenase [Bacteroidales bacterium]
MKKISCIIVSIFIVNMTLCGQDIKLPAPDKTGGKSLMEVLSLRKTNRNFSSNILSEKQIANLLWAANGINREDGKRTAPSARNNQEIDIYTYLATGIYLYLPKENVLKLIKKGDFRKEAVKQEFAQKAPILLIFVANYDKMEGMDESSREFYGATDCGNVSQNVYLYCASEGLNTVALGMIYRDEIKSAIGFNGKAILGQPVGFPE